MLLLSAAGLWNLLDLGLHQTFSNAYTRHFQSGNFEKFTRQMAIGLALMGVVIAVGVAGLVIWVTADWWRLSILTRAIPGADAAAILLMLGLSVLVQTAAGVVSPIYRAQDKFSRGLLLELLSSGLRLTALAATAVAGASPVTVSAVYFFSTVVGYSYMLRDQFKNLNGITLRPQLPRAEELMDTARPATWFYVQHAANVLLIGAPLLVLGHLDGPMGGIAAFGLLRTLTNFIRQVGQILANSPAIELSRLWFQLRDVELIQDRIRRGCRFIAVVVGVLAGGLMLLLGAIFNVWSVGRIEPRVNVGLIFCFGVVLTAPSMLIANFLNYINVARIGAYSRVISLVVATICAIVLARPYELAGVASALVVGETVGFWLVYLPSAARWTGMNQYALAGSWLGYSILGFSPMLILAAAFFGIDGWLRVPVWGAPVLAVIGVITILIFGVSPLDRKKLASGLLRRWCRTPS